MGELYTPPCRCQALLGNALTRSSASPSLTLLPIPGSPPGSGGAKQSLAGRIPKQSLGTTEKGEAALRGTHSQAALGNDKGDDRGAWGGGGEVL